VLKIEKEMLADRQVKLTVTVAPERVQQEMQTAATRISKKVNIPGFRKGKAPYHIILRYFGEDAIFEEALEPLGQAVYSEALEQSDVEPYAPGALSDMTRDPMVMTFEIPLAPEVEMGAYRDVRIPFKVEKVTDKDTDAAIDNLLEQQSTLELVERPVQWEDVATLDIVGTEVGGKGNKAKPASTEAEENGTEEEPFIERESGKVLIAKKATYPVPGFPEEIVGMSVGEERSFDIALPAKSKTIDEDLRGKTFHFVVSCKEVYKREVPTLDDDFAKSAGDYEDLADLRMKVRQQLEEAMEEQARSEYIDKILEHLLASVVKISYPPMMLEEQIDDMVEDFKQRLGQQKLTLDDYFKLNNLTMANLRDDFKEIAKSQLTRALLLGELSRLEGLRVSQEEMDDEIETRLLSFGAQAPMARQVFSSPEVRRSLTHRLMVEKALNRLNLIARGEAPLPEPAPVSDGVPTQSPAE
jgi:trigger factor